MTLFSKVKLMIFGMDIQHEKIIFMLMWFVLTHFKGITPESRHLIVGQLY